MDSVSRSSVQRHVAYISNSKENQALQRLCKYWDKCKDGQARNFSRAQTRLLNHLQELEIERRKYGDIGTTSQSDVDIQRDINNKGIVCKFISADRPLEQTPASPRHTHGASKPSLPGKQARGQGQIQAKHKKESSDGAELQKKSWHAGKPNEEFKLPDINAKRRSSIGDPETIRHTNARQGPTPKLQTGSKASKTPIQSKRRGSLGGSGNDMTKTQGQKSGVTKEKPKGKGSHEDVKDGSKRKGLAASTSKSGHSDAGRHKQKRQSLGDPESSTTKLMHQVHAQSRRHSLPANFLGHKTHTAQSSGTSRSNFTEDLEGLNRHTLDHYYELLAQNERLLNQGQLEEEPPQHSAHRYGPVSTLKRSQQRKAKALEALLNQMPTQRKSSIDAYGSLQCRYLRLTPSNIQSLEDMAWEEGKDPGLHAHMTEAQVLQYFDDLEAKEGIKISPDESDMTQYTMENLY